MPRVPQGNHGFDWYSRRKETEEIRKDLAAIADVMHRVYHCDWWEWNQGSTQFFWRWQPEFKACAQDGIPVWTLGKEPSYQVPQSAPKSTDTRDKVRAKIWKVRNWGYIEKGFVKSLTSYFLVQKAIFDI
jgi:hypothetical protein